MMDWLPIESAPKDHMPRLYLCRGRVVQGFVDVTGALMVQHEFGWRRMRRNPSHWMPLLPLPAKKPPTLDSGGAGEVGNNFNHNEEKGNG